MLLTSPLIRAIHCGLIAFGDHQHDVTVIADQSLREIYNGAGSGAGQRASVLAAMYPTIDFSSLSENWSDGAETVKGFERRVVRGDCLLSLL